MPEASHSEESERDNSLFPATLWEEVIGAKASDPAKAKAALVKLCELYRAPIVKWLHARGFCDAEDLASAFIERLLGKNPLIRFERQQDTKFRSFLLTCLRRFVKDQKAKEQALFRGGGVPAESLDNHDGPAQQPELESELDRRMAQTIHERALSALKGENDYLRELVLPPFNLDGSYAEASKQLGKTPGAIRTAVARLREEYYDAFSRQVGQFTAPAELDEEVHYLMKLVSDGSNHA